MTRAHGVFKRPAIFVPQEYYSEVFKLSKAALADIAWNLAGACSESAEDSPAVMERLREEFVTMYGLPQVVEFCSRCVISNQRPSSTVEYDHTIESKKQTIHFEKGVCDACRAAEAKEKTNWEEREEELQDLCSRFRSRSGAYDCIVPGSGGKDSFFAGHTLRTKYGMHPLLITWAPHLETEWGARNLTRWQEVANHVLYTPSRQTHRLLTRLAVAPALTRRKHDHAYRPGRA